MMADKKWTPKSDAKSDKMAGIKPGSPKDNMLDKKRGVPTGKKPPPFGKK